jgi:hypothetical protein
MTVDQPALVAVGIFLAYMLLVGVIWRVTGTGYDALVDSGEHVVRGIILPIGIGAIFLALTTTWLGWWDSALFEDSRSRTTSVQIVAAFVAGQRRTRRQRKRAVALVLQRAVP